MKAIRKHLGDFAAIVGLVLIAAVVGGYILDNQRLRFPFLDEEPFVLKAEFASAQAVTPGQGQTVRVSGIRIGDIAKTELREGRAIITMELDRKYERLVREDATALLRPKTGLKDMFIELNPGSKQAPVAREGFTMPISSTLPDVNPDEVLASLDADTRDYLKLLLNGAGQGLRGRGGDLRDVLKRFEPLYRDLAKVSGSVKQRRVELRRLVTSLRVLNEELAGRDDELARLISSSSEVFNTLASERDNVAATVRNLPAALEETRDGLAKVEAMARVLRPTADDLRPVARALRSANEATRPFAEEATPLLRRDVRPFVRELSPLVRELTPAADDLVEAEPNLTKSFEVLNHLFNMLGHNPNGKEGPDAANRDEGYLFYLSWLTHQSTALFANADAHGPQRNITLGGACSLFLNTAKTQPQAEQVLNLTGLLTDPAICGGETAAAERREKAAKARAKARAAATAKAGER